MPIALPIDRLRGKLEKAWMDHRNFILRSPTGSGKSTRVPRFLWEWEGFDREKTVMVLQPRRMAARLLARRVASELGEAVGDTAGYRIRFEAKASANTRLLYVTEGLLLRRLASGDALEDVGAILFDEFHERHLEGDLCLGLAVRLQSLGWNGRIGVLSATLDTGHLADFLPDTALLESEGRQFPVDINYLSGSPDERIWDRAAAAVKRAIADGAKADILLFMPGKYEINNTVRALSGLRETTGWEVLPLHGELDSNAQDRAVESGDIPRIIVTTNIAETSLTLPGVRTVVDSGLVRMPDFDPRRGVNTLLTEKISRASADQRAGRAGRIEPGRCYRMWSKSDHEHRDAFTAPEIERLDLSEACLQLASLELGDDFPWFQPPPENSWKHALELLSDLGALKQGTITDLGRQMVRYPLHPRFSRMVIAARETGCLDLVIAAIALSEARRIILPINDKRKDRERETWWTAAEGVSDLLRDVMIWQRYAEQGGSMAFCREWGIHGQSLVLATRVFRQLSELAGKDQNTANPDPDGFGKCMLTGYSDQLGRRLDRGTLRCELVHGRRGLMQRDSIVDKADLFVASSMEEREFRGEATLFLGGLTAVREEWLDELFPGEKEVLETVRLDEDRRRIECVRQTRFRGLVLKEQAGTDPDPAMAAQLLAQHVVGKEWPLKKWNEEAENWIRRVNVLATHCPEWEIKPIEPNDRLLLIEQICDGAMSYKEIKDRPVMPVLHSWLPDNILPLLDEWVPIRFPLSDKGNPKLRYEEDGSVVLPARIQQLYDVPGDSLSICHGRCRLKIELLAPSGRPVQITEDLDGFWTGQYPQVRKDLFGRYPKHEWR